MCTLFVAVAERLLHAIKRDCSTRTQAVPGRSTICKPLRVADLPLKVAGMEGLAVPIHLISDQGVRRCSALEIGPNER